MLTDAPAACETYPGFDMSTSSGLTAPKCTSAPGLATPNAGVNRLLRLLAKPEMRETPGKPDVVPAGGTQDAIRSEVEAASEARGALMRELNIEAG